MQKTKLNRRELLASAGVAAAAATFTIVPRHVIAQSGQPAPSDKINVACIGAGGQGGGDLNACAGDKGVNVVAMADVDTQRAEGSIKRFSQAKFYRDFRKMFDEMEKNIDAVIVGTPDHTHAVAVMAALKRKKHVYCEKPLCHSVYEARELVKAAKEANVVTQLGNQGHSGDSIRLLCEWIWDGAIGKVQRIDLGCAAVNSAMDSLKDIKEAQKPPDSLDWDLWLGPAKERPYHKSYCPSTWRGWVPFGSGTIGDWGCHVVDPVFWALDLGAPKTIQAEVKDWDYKTQGDAYPKGDKVTFTFPAKGGRGEITMVWHSGTVKIPRAEVLEAGRKGLETHWGVDTGAYVYGDKGVIIYGSHGADGVRLIPETKMKEYKRPEPKLPRVRGGHHADWLQAIRQGKKAGSDFSYGGPLTEIALIGVIAIKLHGTNLEWDGEKCQFTNSADANALLKETYRTGWTL